MRAFGFFKRKLLCTILVAATLVLSSFPLSVPVDAESNFTLPCSIETYGDAWLGYLSFYLEGSTTAQIVANTDGAILNMRESVYVAGGACYNIATDTLLLQGEPPVNGTSTTPELGTHFWNFINGTDISYPNVVSHHDIQYNPDKGTFLVLQNYARTVQGKPYLFDKILEVNADGSILWSWDVYGHISLSEASSFNETAIYNGENVKDFSHANSLDWHYNENIIYLNLRCTDTFYKIDQTTGDIIWSCGQFGNFTLLDDNCAQVPSLWYHSHDTKEISPNVFTMFDNDYNNITNPHNCHSRMIELTVNETDMTAYVTWSWEAPEQYWNVYGGSNVLLPNGDFLGCFGDPTHQFPANKPWNFSNTGAVIVEVNRNGDVVRTFTFPVGWYIYRVEPVTDLSDPPALISPLSQALMVVRIVAVAILIVGVLAILLYLWRKRTSDSQKS